MSSFWTTNIFKPTLQSHQCLDESHPISGDTLRSCCPMLWLDLAIPHYIVSKITNGEARQVIEKTKIILTVLQKWPSKNEAHDLENTKISKIHFVY